MAFKRLASGNIAAASPLNAYTVPTNSNASVSRFVLTNNTANNISVDVSVNDGAVRLIKSVTIPGGVGKSVFVFEAYDSYNGNDIIVIEPGSADSFNYLISGREV